jgi:hypothetical protein
MLKSPRLRRPLALLLIVLGGVLMFLAAEVWTGVLVLILGVALEWIGIRLEHQDAQLPKG